MARLNPSICNPRALFIDLSGTIHIEDKVVPQSIEAINALKQSNVPHLFVTNTSKVCKGYQKVLFYNQFRTEAIKITSCTYHLI